MNTSVTNLINMIRATILYCTTNAAATAAIAAFLVSRTAAEGKLVLIDALNIIAGTPTKGVTLNTKSLRAVMETLGIKCALALQSYADSIPDSILYGKVNYTKSTLKLLKKEDVADVCQKILNEAITHLAAAGDRGYDATDITNLTSAIALYRTSIQSPRQAVITRVQAIRQIKVLANSIRDIDFKKNMDKMAKTLESTNPNFLSGYLLAREVIDLGSTTAKIRGTVKNQQGTLLFGVRVYLTKTGLPPIIAETQTSAEGKFSISHIPADNYDVHYELGGYQSYMEANLHIPAGKEFKRNITLPYITVYTGTIPSNGFVNVFSPSTPVWRIGVTVNIKNVTAVASPSSIRPFTAYTPTDPGSGVGDVQLANGQQIQHTVSAADFKPYLSIFNQGPNPASFEITIL